MCVHCDTWLSFGMLHTQTRTQNHTRYQLILCESKGHESPGTGEKLHTCQRRCTKDGRPSVMKSNQYCAYDRHDEMLLRVEERVKAMLLFQSISLDGCPHLKSKWFFGKIPFSKRNYFVYCLVTKRWQARIVLLLQEQCSSHLWPRQWILRSAINRKRHGG